MDFQAFLEDGIPVMQMTEILKKEKALDIILWYRFDPEPKRNPDRIISYITINEQLIDVHFGEEIIFACEQFAENYPDLELHTEENANMFLMQWTKDSQY